MPSLGGSKKSHTEREHTVPPTSTRQWHNGVHFEYWLSGRKKRTASSPPFVPLFRSRLMHVCHLLLTGDPLSFVKSLSDLVPFSVLRPSARTAPGTRCSEMMHRGHLRRWSRLASTTGRVRSTAAQAPGGCKCTRPTGHSAGRARAAFRGAILAQPPGCPSPAPPTGPGERPRTRGAARACGMAATATAATATAATATAARAARRCAGEG